MTGLVLDQLDLPQELPLLYGLMSAEDQYLYSTRLRFPTEQGFRDWFYQRLGQSFHDFYAVRRENGGALLGYVHNYDFSLVNGTCKLVVYLRPELRETGLGGIAAVLFMKKLFSDYPLRKLYSTIYDYNQESLICNRTAGFVEEGVLREYRYYGGAYHDLHCLSMTRERFDATLGRLVSECSV